MWQGCYGVWQSMKPLFENAHFLLVDKRPGYLSVPSRFGKQDPRPCELVLWSEIYGILSPVHRLDEEVSGLLLFARSREAHQASNQWFENRSIRKNYEALTESKSGIFPNSGEEFLWKSKLLRGKKRAYEKPFGKLAVTGAVFQGVQEIEGKRFGFWKLSPETGRSHQLRYELAKFGSPIWGDALYGSTLKYANGIALRATKLDLTNCPRRASFGIPSEFQVSSLECMTR